MGGKTKIKNEQKEADLLKKQTALYQGSAKHKNPEPLPDLSSYFSDYRIFAVRDPSTFVFRGKSRNRVKQFIHLVRHTFEKYPAPKIFEQCWEAFLLKEKRLNVSTDNIKFAEWYICVASGGSLYKEYTKDFLTKKETHIFLSAPSQLTVRQGLYFSIARAIGADVNLAFMIGRSKLAEKDFKNEFWRNCARFFATHNPGSLNVLNDIIDYVNHRFAENCEYSLFGGGHTVESLIKQMHQWHADLRRVKVIGNYSWEGHGINDQTLVTKINNEDKHWIFTQIKTAKELAAEGNAMRHCVYGYRDRCVSGSISIWSLSTGDEFGQKKRRATIELVNDGRITQARGVANRSLKPEERNIIARWASKNGLTFGSYCY